MGISKTSDHIQIKIKMQNPSQDPSASSKRPNEDLKDMDVLCTLKIKIESKSKNSDHIKIKIPNPSQEPPVSSKAPNEDFKDIDVLCTKDQWLYTNQVQNAKPKSGTFSSLQSPKWWLKGHGCSLHLQNQDREPKFGSLVYQRPLTIYKSKSKCQTQVINLQRPPKPQMRT